MDYAEIPVPPSLEGLVAAIWTLRADQPGWVEHEAVPDGCIELIRRNSGRSIWKDEQPPLFATGLSEAPIRFGFSGDARFTAIKLWPWAWHALGGKRCAEFAGDWIAVEQHSSLSMLLPERGDPAPRITKALEGVQSPLGRSILAARSVSDMVLATGLSYRALQRQFAYEFGMPPRSYLKLLRFREALLDIQDSRETLADRAAARGYADQAHMTRDFRTHAGLPPGEARVRAKGPFL
jgi:AraC-like DNA-binding protein